MLTISILGNSDKIEIDRESKWWSSSEIVIYDWCVLKADLTEEYGKHTLLF